VARYPCAVISGRARADLLDKLGGLEVQCVVGNHGAETDFNAGDSRGSVEQWRVALERELDGVPGVWIEDKGLSLAVHYRQSASPSRARQKIMAATHDLTRVHVFGGKRVVNLTPDSAPRKGTALAEARRRLECEWVLYVGDDENDEEAFALKGNVVSVRIGRASNSHADYYLRSQAEVDVLLEQMVLLRESNERGEQPERRRQSSS
jgi:trehalose 6-phosphate phosphatase